MKAALTRGERYAVLGAGVAVAAVFGLWYYEKQKAAPGPIVASPSSVAVTLAPGTMPSQTLSLSLTPTLQITPADGATGTSVSSQDATTVSIGTATAAGVIPASGLKVGSTTLEATWTDSTGTNQTANIFVTVEA